MDSRHEDVRVLYTETLAKNRRAKRILELHMMDNAIFMSGEIWATSPVENTPEIMLRAWCVMELKDGDRHFIGYNVTEHEGRVSSKIMIFDSKMMRGITRSGRVYQLDGPSGYDDDAFYVWNRWRSINNISEYTNVSDNL